MTPQEYEQKKRECWEEFIGTDGFPTETMRQCFNFAFDRAYALGREKETITQEEIEEAAEDYVSFEKGGKCYPNYIVERACCCAFKDGVNYALGKQEKDTVIQGWVCRDKKDDALNLHAEEPYRTQSGYQIGDKPDWWESDCASFLPLDKNLFPDLTWESEPEEVEIIIKRKKNL